MYRKYLLYERALIALLVLCTRNICECQDSCQNGFFGPSCAYIDLRYRSTNVATKDEHGPGNRCIDLGGDFQKVLIDVTDTIISWIRITRIDKAAATYVKISLKLEDGTLAVCPDEKRHISKNVIDVYCNPTNQPIYTRQVVVQGNLKSTCDVQISGGRYLCKDGVVKMSSIYGGTKAHNCVDRNKGTMCSTRQGDKRPKIRIKFNELANIFSFHITNVQGFPERIKNALVKLLDDNSLKVWSKQITKVQQQYDVNIKNIESSVRTLEISIYSQLKPMISIMEIEVYGESVCSNYFKRTYGMSCEKNCNCANKSEQCLFVTGGCPDGCNYGYQGVDCKESCSSNLYGINCAKQCSKKCVGFCDQGTGKCSWCLPGFHGPKCNLRCTSGTYGASCAQRCPNCQDHRCNRYNGTCIASACLPGWVGEKCDQRCVTDTWGQNCSSECSTNCAGDGMCSNIDGTCLSGCLSDYDPPTCVKKKAPETLLKATIASCLLLSVCVAAVLIYFCMSKPTYDESLESEETFEMRY